MTGSLPKSIPDSPQSGNPHCAPARPVSRSGRWWILWLCLIPLAGELAGEPSPAVAQQLVDAGQTRFSIRVVWGGGSPRTWQGSLHLSEGYMRLSAPLGMESDSGAALRISNNLLEIRSIRASEFAGADLDLFCTASASLQLELESGESPGERLQRTIDLSSILDPSADGVRFPLDEEGNVIDIRPAGGSELPVSFERDHLVFRTQETFSFLLNSVELPFPSEARLLLRVRMTPARSGEIVDEREIPIAVTADGWLRATPVELRMPADPGAYNIHLEIRETSLSTRLGFTRNRVFRTIQVVAIDRFPRRENPLGDVTGWQQVQSTGMADHSWLPRIPGLVPARLTSGSREAGLREVVHAGRPYTEMAAGGWQAIPLKLESIGKPHLVEVEYLDRGPMAVGISVLQPDATGKTRSFGADSGIHIPDSGLNGDETRVRVHRFWFWPQYKQPYLLFANRHADQAAVIGEVRILAGPDQLAAREGAVARRADSRHYLAFYQQPLFVENFSVSKFPDPETGYPLDDWHAWLTGASRWVEYLKASGHTGAMLVVMSDGGSLYPASRIQPTPRLENAMLGSRPLDPVRKDVVELLLRLFQREGLQLVPVLHFNAPLPAVEQMRAAASGDESTALVLTSLSGESREDTWQAGSEMSFYNPLHPDVQQAATDVVRDFTRRYAHHESLGGIGLMLSRYSLPVMPGQSWGADPVTFARFAEQHLADEMPDEITRPFVSETLNGPARQAWLLWRQQQIGQWLTSMREAVTEFAPSGKLFLLGTDLFETQDAFSTLVPSLRRRSDLAVAAARIGLPLETVAADEQMIFLRPFSVAPEKSLADRRLNFQLNLWPRDREGRAVPDDGILFLRHYAWAHFEQLQRSQPFGQPETHPVMRLQPLIAGESWSCQPLADGMLTGQPLYIVDGGWLAGLGQEQATASWVEQFTRLPAVRFTPVEPVTTDSPVGSVVRQVVHGESGWFYILNPTPWETRVTLQWSGKPSWLQSLSGESWLPEDNGPGQQLTLHLQPFELKAGMMDAEATITGFREQPDPAVPARLQERLDRLVSRVSQAEQAPPMDVLANPDFEPVEEASADNRFGWYYDQSSAESISLQSESPWSGDSSLSLRSSGPPVWIRSEEFAAPGTGRLSVSVMLRTRNPEQQPPLRISVQGSDGEQLYYRFGSVGQADGVSEPIGSGWREFAVHFDDLPPGEDLPVRIGFDLMGSGEVQIDHVQVFDRWLDKQDSTAITQRLQIAGFELSGGGNLDKCRRILEDYWSCFLEEYFPAEGAGKPQAEQNSQARAPGEAGPSGRTSGLQNLIPPSIRRN